MVYILLGTGFEEIEALCPGDILRRARIPMQYVGLSGKAIEGAHGIQLVADITVEEMDLSAMDMIVLPGGSAGVESIHACTPALEAVRFAYENDKFVAAICAAPTLLASLGMLEGKKATCYPGLEARMAGAVMQEGEQAVTDGKIITGRGPGAAMDFGLTLVKALQEQAAYTAQYVAQCLAYGG